MYRERYSTGAEHLRDEGPDARTMVVRAEEMLWSSSAQRDRERLEWLLHHDYTGVTRDGVHVTRDEAISATARSAPRGERDFTEWELHAMPWPLVLVTYRLADDTGDSRHVSIWDISTGLARLRFHQGTWQEAPPATPELTTISGFRAEADLRTAVPSLSS